MIPSLILLYLIIGSLVTGWADDVFHLSRSTSKVAAILLWPLVLIVLLIHGFIYLIEDILFS